MLLTILAFIIVIGVLITIHEFGHFIVAKLFKIKVLVFSIGFGPKLLSYKGKETEYRLSAIPLGGYVKMAGQESILEGKPVEEGDFYSKSPFKRILVVLGGPVSNFILAFLIFMAVMIIGTQQLVFKPVVGGITEQIDMNGKTIETPAYLEGIEKGDRFIKANGEDIKYWSDIQNIVFFSDGEPVHFVIERSNEFIEKDIKPVFNEDEGVWMIGVYPQQDTEVSLIVPGSPSDRAGLKEGDEIQYVNKVRVNSWNDIQKQYNKAEKKINLTVLRGDEKELVVLEKTSEEMGLLELGFITGMEKVVVRESFKDAFINSGRQTIFMSGNILKGIGLLIIGKVSPKEALGGPLTIADYAGRSIKAGWDSFLNYIAILSIILFVLNLLPIPVLDGGNILLSIIEAIKGSLVSLKFRMIFQQIGLVLLFAIMIFAIAMDVIRYVF
jgi:regulator of sigma E protease